MRDLKGILRGACQVCGQAECDTYMTSDEASSPLCLYCGCPPAKHNRTPERSTNTPDPVPTTQAHTTPPDLIPRTPLTPPSSSKTGSSGGGHTSSDSSNSFQSPLPQPNPHVKYETTSTPYEPNSSQLALCPPPSAHHSFNDNQTIDGPIDSYNPLINNPSHNHYLQSLGIAGNPFTALIARQQPMLASLFAARYFNNNLFQPHNNYFPSSNNLQPNKITIPATISVEPSKSESPIDLETPVTPPPLSINNESASKDNDRAIHDSPKSTGSRSPLSNPRKSLSPPQAETAPHIPTKPVRCIADMTLMQQQKLRADNSVQMPEAVPALHGEAVPWTLKISDSQLAQAHTSYKVVYKGGRNPSLIPVRELLDCDEAGRRMLAHSANLTEGARDALRKSVVRRIGNYLLRRAQCASNSLDAAPSAHDKCAMCLDLVETLPTLRDANSGPIGCEHFFESRHKTGYLEWYIKNQLKSVRRRPTAGKRTRTEEPQFETPNRLSTYNPVGAPLNQANLSYRPPPPHHTFPAFHYDIPRIPFANIPTLSNCDQQPPMKKAHTIRNICS